MALSHLRVLCSLHPRGALPRNIALNIACRVKSDGSPDRLVLKSRTARGRLLPGDPKECREHAKRCAELAACSETPESKRALLNLEKHWLRLADAILSALREIESTKSPDS